MASGNMMAELDAVGSLQTTTLYATRDYVADASTPAGVSACLDYDGSAQDEHAEWQFDLPDTYSGGGFDLIIKYACDGTATGAVQFEVRAIKLVDTSDLDSDLGMDTATATDITDTPTGTANAMMVTAAGSITHANAGSPSAGDRMRVRVTRDYDHAANTDDAQLVAVYVKET